MLLCLLYVLRATDCHHENLIAHGDQLILIDTETLLHPCDIAIDGLQDSTGNGPGAGERFLDSVMRIGLLPRWNLSPDKRVAFDISGLGSTVPQRVPHDVARWQAINTDDMHLRYVSVTFPLEKNIPMLDGQAVSPHAYRDRICEGFRKMYLFLISRKEELLAENGPLAGMKGHRVRYIFRDSQVYGSILDRALAPEYLQNGAAFGIELEHLARAYLTDREKPSAWNLLDEEIRAMERLDIPLLTADTSSCDLYADSKLVLRNCFRQPSFHDALDQIRAMDDDDLAWQSAIIAGSFDAMVANSPAVPDRRICAVESGIAGNQFALEEAFRIGEELAVRALHDPGGGSTWVGLGYMLRAERYQFRILGDNLYDGTPGVAVFFAGLYRQTGETRFRDLALSAVHGLRVRINRQGSHPRLQDDFDTLIGGAIGLGSRIYALVKVGTILGDSEVIEDARLLLAALSDETVRGDEQLDVMGGAAGAILGILSLYNAIRDPAALQAAHACGRSTWSRARKMFPVSGGHGALWNPSRLPECLMARPASPTHSSGCTRQRVRKNS